MSEKNKIGESRRYHKWLPKVTCLLLSFFIWLYVMLVDSPEHEEIFYSIDITLINTGTLEDRSGLSVYSGYGSTVNSLPPERSQKTLRL